jgi:hypothetical protein
LGFPYPYNSDINLKNVSHKITDIKMDENEKCIVATLELLDTKNGKKVKSILNKDLI